MNDVVNAAMLSLSLCLSPSTHPHLSWIYWLQIAPIPPNNTKHCSHCAFLNW